MPELLISPSAPPSPAAPFYFDINDSEVVGPFDPNNVLKSVTQVGNTITIELFGGLGLATDTPSTGVGWLIPMRVSDGRSPPDRVDWNGGVRPVAMGYNMFFPTPPVLGTDAWAMTGVSAVPDFSGSWMGGGLVGQAAQTSFMAMTNSTGFLATAAPLSVGFAGGIGLTSGVAGNFTAVRANMSPYNAAELQTLLGVINGGKTLGATPWLFLAAGRASIVGGDTTVVVRVENSTTPAVSSYLIPAIP